MDPSSPDPAPAAAPTGAAGATLRRRVLAASLAAVLVLCALTGQFLATRETPVAMIAAHAALFVGGIAVWLAALQAPSRRQAALLLATAALARLLLLPFLASDDVNRYLWEGRLVLAGESPYAAPAADAAPPWRDGVWAGMNNKDKLTAYPPLAEAVFAAGVAVGYDPLPLKLLFVAAEMATLLLLAGELRRRRLPPAHLALAAFNPVLLLATAAEGHFDALFALALVVALLRRARGRDAWAWVALAAAVQLKLVAVLLIPLFLRRGGWRSAWAFLPAAILPCVPYLEDLDNLARGIATFGSVTYHGGLLPTALTMLGAGTSAAALTGYAALAGWTGLVTWRVRDPWRATFLILGALLLVSPVVHLWYFAWIVPFLVLAPQPAWLLLTGLQALYFATWAHALATEQWTQPPWAWWGEWAPFLLLLAATGWPSLRRLADLRRPFEADWPAPATISVVVPTLNESAGIENCLAAVRRQGPAVREIIVADGGSRDDTVALAAAAGAQVIEAPRGRGRQVAAGVASASGDVIWIVHADSRPATGTAGAILDALRAEPAAAGGAAGQRFTRSTGLLLGIEGLNALRSALFGLSFGDQGQFVRRAALPTLGGYPALPLMEDVELSLRLRRAGPVLHLGRNALVSSRRWDASRPVRRISTVLRLTGRYLLSRRRERLSEDLFAAYYPINEK